MLMMLMLNCSDLFFPLSSTLSCYFAYAESYQIFQVDGSLSTTTTEDLLVLNTKDPNLLPTLSLGPPGSGNRELNRAVDTGLHFAVAAGNDNYNACDYSAEKAITVRVSYPRLSLDAIHLTRATAFHTLPQRGRTVIRHQHLQEMTSDRWIFTAFFCRF
jgi:hypothetical protein